MARIELEISDSDLLKLRMWAMEKSIDLLRNESLSWGEDANYETIASNIERWALAKGQDNSDEPA